MRREWWLGLAMLLAGCAPTTQPDERLSPVSRPFDETEWVSCTDMKPVEGASDGSQTAICINKAKQRYEIIYRSIHKACEPSVSVKDLKDSYQHFLCEEKFELMIRPEQKAAGKP